RIHLDPGRLLPQLHDRALAELTLDLLHGQIESLGALLGHLSPHSRIHDHLRCSPSAVEWRPTGAPMRVGAILWDSDSCARQGAETGARGVRPPACEDESLRAQYTGLRPDGGHFS